MIPIRYNFRSLLERRTTSLMTVLGLGLVAMIFVILFGFIGGLKGTMLNAAGERNWVLLGRGSPDETASFIPHALIDVVRVRPEIATSDSGQPLISPEIFAGVNISRDKHVTAVRADARRDADRNEGASQHAPDRGALADSR